MKQDRLQSCTACSAMLQSMDLSMWRLWRLYAADTETTDCSVQATSTPPPVPANSPGHMGTERSAARRLHQHGAPSSLHNGTAISLPTPSPMRTMFCKKDTIYRRTRLRRSSHERTSAAASASPLSHRSRNSAYKDTCSSSCYPLWCQDHQGTSAWDLSSGKRVSLPVPALQGRRLPMRYSITRTCITSVSGL